MIYGIGIDLLDFSQVSIENEQLIKRVLTDKELALFHAKTSAVQRMCFFAGRFAAKEAYVKALGTGFRNVTFQDIEVLNNELGQPQLHVRAVCDRRVPALVSHLSISHSASAASAVVVLEEKGE
jgi:holo-[acyl-carrier protein] synthase